MGMWTYEQTGHLITPDGMPSAHTWYSGHAEHANKPQDEGLKGLGPLPRGTYTFGELVRNTHMGPVAIHLVPDSTTRSSIQSMGRDPDSFFAHSGDVARDHNASAGCLVCMDGISGVLSLWGSTDRTLRCISGLGPVAPAIPASPVT